jgi:enoyl-[acyl-carrier protein] reductase/trans-2-enoyl-CoA reductase (NAD+)
MAIIKPMVRSNICLNAHPVGCAKETERQIEYVKTKKAERGIKGAKEGGNGPKFVLVLGCSTGYGLASRISAAFEYGADTIGVSFEKEPTEKKGGTPGWYNNAAFDRAAKNAGLISETFNADAFSHETRKLIIEEAKKLGRKFDLVVYSLASPVRSDPDKIDPNSADGNHILYKSVLKPIGKTYSGYGIDILTDSLKESSAEPATEEEIANTEEFIDLLRTTESVLIPTTSGEETTYMYKTPMDNLLVRKIKVMKARMNDEPKAVKALEGSSNDYLTKF